MLKSSLTLPVTRRGRWSALLLAVPIAIALAAPITVVGLSRLGPAPTPAAPVLRAETIPAVHAAPPESLNPAPVTVVSSTADSVEAQSPADEPLSIVQTDQAPASAGGLNGGVVLRDGRIVSAGGAGGGVVNGR